jgi:16S rRNA (cytosine1402-N4)-methyltransferase
VLGLDTDPDAVARARERLAPFSNRTEIVHTSYSRVLDEASARGWVPVDGIVFDLGFSSQQIEDPARGFTFRVNGPLDMRFDPTVGSPTAAELANGLSCEELAAIIWRFGEEQRSRKIAEAITAARPILTTVELVAAIESVTGRRGRIHPATKTFQALRIAVNDELSVIAMALPQAVEILATGGRIAVISFHSLEDRVVKDFLRRESRDCICPAEVPVCTCHHRATLRIVSRKPIRPTEREVMENPRSRSARLRVAEKL